MGWLSVAGMQFWNKTIGKYLGILVFFLVDFGVKSAVFDSKSPFWTLWNRRKGAGNGCFFCIF